MFRALSVRRNNHGYDRLGVDSSSAFGEAATEVKLTSSSSGEATTDAKLTRARSVPARILWGSSKKPNPEVGLPQQGQGRGTLKSSSSKKSSKRYHPLLSLFDGRWRRKKPTAKPEFARYMEYVKEGGVWDKNTDMPVIYYK